MKTSDHMGDGKQRIFYVVTYTCALALVLGDFQAKQYFTGVPMLTHRVYPLYQAAFCFALGALLFAMSAMHHGGRLHARWWLALDVALLAATPLIIYLVYPVGFVTMHDGFFLLATNGGCLLETLIRRRRGSKTDRV